MRVAQGIHLSPQKIYDYIANCPNATDKKHLQRQLRYGGWPYRCHGTRARATARQRVLPSIHDRPRIIAARQRLGDMEGDTIVGLDTRNRLITHVDRTAGDCSLDKILGRSARKVADAIARQFQASRRLSGP